VVSPTEEGRRLYQHCARLIAAAREADLVLSSTQRDGPVRVSAPVAFAQLHLTAGVAEFLRRQSDATVHLDATDRLVDLVADGVDLAVRFGRLADSSLVARRLFRDAIVGVASPQYLEHRGAPRHASDVHRHVWLRYSTEWFRGDRPPWMRRRATRARAAGRRFIGGDVVVVSRAAAEGLGIAMLPSHVVAADVAAGRLVRILEHWPLPLIDVWLIHPRQRPMPARVRCLLDFLVARFRDRAWQRRALLAPAR
jgi:DNA-binding transcriptional LysR family regulator